MQVPDDEDWAFEAETDLWDDGEQPTPPSDDEPEPTDPVGQDADSVVTVVVSPEGAVERVRLAQDWKSRVDPRGLDTNVVAAANAAVLDAVVRQAREVQATPQSQPPADADETPLTAEDVLRLDDAVHAELEEFSAQLASVDVGIVSAESSGGHVSGTAQGGRYLDLDLDPTWATIARNAEVESELLDVLRTLHRRSTPAELAPHPQGQAYTELMGLLFDPARLLRRVGLPPPPGLFADQEGRDLR
jgi:DNA-binding protein YbaB